MVASDQPPNLITPPNQQAAARCKLSIEALETSSESSADRSTTSTAMDGSVAAREQDEIYQRLIERYSVLKDTMMDWGVEVSERLRERTRRGNGRRVLLHSREAVDLTLCPCARVHWGIAAVHARHWLESHHRR